jgi:hypothetical protein
MTPIGFEPTISAQKQPQNYNLDHMANGTGYYIMHYTQILSIINVSVGIIPQHIIRKVINESVIKMNFLLHLSNLHNNNDIIH